MVDGSIRAVTPQLLVINLTGQKFPQHLGIDRAGQAKVTGELATPFRGSLPPLV
jgi:hypothetical protein